MKQYNSIFYFVLVKTKIMEPFISNGMKKKAFEFSLAVYRVTDLFPAGEALKRQTREIANELLRTISEVEAKESFDKDTAKRAASVMLVLKNFLLLAKYNRFVAAVNIDVLLKELSFFESFFLRQLHYRRDFLWQENGQVHKEETEEKTAVFVQPQKSVSETQRYENKQNQFPQEQEKATHNGCSDRQRAILDYLRAKKTAKANDLAVVFSNRFSLKTLQRDLAMLIEQKAVERKGDKRWAIYMIPGQESEAVVAR